MWKGYWIGMDWMNVVISTHEVNICRGPFFFGPRQTKSKVHQAQWFTVTKTWKEMAKRHQPSPRPKRKGEVQPIWTSRPGLPGQHQKIQNDSKKKRENGCLRKRHFFPPLLVRRLRHWREAFPKHNIIFPKLDDYSEELVLFISH